jgi:hypothetical protein
LAVFIIKFSNITVRDPDVSHQKLGFLIKNEILTLFGSYGLKGGNKLFYFPAFAFWTPGLLLLVLHNPHGERKLFLAFLAHEFVRGHGVNLL